MAPASGMYEADKAQYCFVSRRSGLASVEGFRKPVMSYPRHDGNNEVPIPESRMSFTLIVHLCS